MSNRTELGTGRSENDLHEAVQAAWEKAKEHPEVKGNGRTTYECKISIEASNPIHSYIVTILHP